MKTLLTRPEPQDAFPGLQHLYNFLNRKHPNVELQEIANEADYAENAHGQDGDYAGFDQFLKKG